MSVTDDLAGRVVARLVDATLVTASDAAAVQTALSRGKLNAKAWLRLLESAPAPASDPRAPGE